MMTLFAMMMPDDAASHAAEARISFNPLYHGSLRAIGCAAADDGAAAPERGDDVDVASPLAGSSLAKALHPGWRADDMDAAIGNARLKRLPV